MDDADGLLLRTLDAIVKYRRNLVGYNEVEQLVKELHRGYVSPKGRTVMDVNDLVAACKAYSMFGWQVKRQLDNILAGRISDVSPADALTIRDFLVAADPREADATIGCVLAEIEKFLEEDCDDM